MDEDTIDAEYLRLTNEEFLWKAINFIAMGMYQANLKRINETNRGKNRKDIMGPETKSMYSLDLMDKSSTSGFLLTSAATVRDIAELLEHDILYKAAMEFLYEEKPEHIQGKLSSILQIPYRINDNTLVQLSLTISQYIIMNTEFPLVQDPIGLPKSTQLTRYCEVNLRYLARFMLVDKELGKPNYLSSLRQAREDS